MNCTDLMHTMGWGCTDMAGHPGVHYITTPFTLKGGRPLSFYIEQRGAGFHFTDDGDILWALRTVGHPLDDQRHWRGLGNLGARAGIPLDERGRFTAEGDAANMPDMAARWSALFAAILDWDAERLESEDMDQTLEREVERILAKRPNVALTPDARITAGGVEFDFSFRWGQTLVDAVPLHAAATNARLRKALLVLRADADQAMLFVLDDRTDITRADREIALLGEVAPAVALRNLEYATANQ